MFNYLDYMAFAMVFDVVARLFLVLENPYWGMIPVFCQIAKNPATADGVLETLMLTFGNWMVSFYIRDLGNHALTYDFWLLFLFSIWFLLFKAYLGSVIFAVALLALQVDREANIKFWVYSLVLCAVIYFPSLEELARATGKPPKLSQVCQPLALACWSCLTLPYYLLGKVMNLLWNALSAVAAFGLRVVAGRLWRVGNHLVEVAVHLDPALGKRDSNVAPPYLPPSSPPPSPQPEPEPEPEPLPVPVPVLQPKRGPVLGFSEVVTTVEFDPRPLQVSLLVPPKEKPQPEPKIRGITRQKEPGTAGTPRPPSPRPNRANRMREDRRKVEEHGRQLRLQQQWEQAREQRRQTGAPVSAYIPFFAPTSEVTPAVPAAAATPPQDPPAAVETAPATFGDTSPAAPGAPLPEESRDRVEEPVVPVEEAAAAEPEPESRTSLPPAPVPAPAPVTAPAPAPAPAVVVDESDDSDDYYEKTPSIPIEERRILKPRTRRLQRQPQPQPQQAPPSSTTSAPLPLPSLRNEQQPQQPQPQQEQQQEQHQEQQQQQRKQQQQQRKQQQEQQQEQATPVLTVPSLPAPSPLPSAQNVQQEQPRPQQDMEWEGEPKKESQVMDTTPTSPRLTLPPPPMSPPRLTFPPISSSTPTLPMLTMPPPPPTMLQAPQAPQVPQVPQVYQQTQQQQQPTPMSLDSGRDEPRGQGDEQSAVASDPMDVDTHRYGNIDHINPAFLLPPPEKKPKPVLVTPTRAETSKAGTGAQKSTPRPPLSEEERQKKFDDYLRRKKQRAAAVSPLIAKKPTPKRP